MHNTWWNLRRGNFELGTCSTWGNPMKLQKLWHTTGPIRWPWKQNNRDDYNWGISTDAIFAKPYRSVSINRTGVLEREKHAREVGGVIFSLLPSIPCARFALSTSTFRLPPFPFQRILALFFSICPIHKMQTHNFVLELLIFQVGFFVPQQLGFSSHCWKFSIFRVSIFLLSLISLKL